MRAVPPFALAATRHRGRRVDRLAARLPRVGLDGVLADLDRAGEPGAVPGEAAEDGFTWDAADRSDPGWWPQGVAATRSGRVLLVSWYAKRRRLRTQGVRLSVVDRSSPAGPRYRHVLLVVPRRLPGLPPWLGRVPVHAGGIAVCGDLLHVADTLAGVRVFRLGDVLRAPRGGYGYVLPQVTAFRVPLRAGRRRLRYSFLSVGTVDGRPRLVVGEYRRAGSHPRLASYPLDPRTGLPATDASGICAPLEVHEDQPVRMQGAAVHGSRWFLTASTGEGRPGDLHVGAPGRWRRRRGVLPPGPEDLAWSRPGEELWSVTEWPGSRWVFRVRTEPGDGV
ncbi:hypothetical protein ACI8AF_14480 [Blastococcus sp. SYSU D00669]